MQFALYALLAAAIVAADQVVKYLVVSGIAAGTRLAFLPGVLDLTYVQNTGAAFSTFQGAQWLFALVFAMLTVGLFYEYFRKRLPFTRFDRWCIAAIYGGGLGNMIDRLRLGYVVDMFETSFIRFPVFNVADIFITCGCIVLLVHLVFWNKAFWKDAHAA